jgi:hypothetical protein
VLLNWLKGGKCMNEKRMVFYLFAAIPIVLLIIFCVKSTDGFESSDIPGPVGSPLFESRIESYLTNGALTPQLNSFEQSRTQADLPVVKPYVPRVEKVIAFYNGEIVGGLGPSFYRVDWEAAIRITPQELAPYHDWELIGARFYHWEKHSNEGSLKIYKQGTASSPGELITSEPYNVSGKGWKRINLTTPVPLDTTKDIWTSFLIRKHGYADYPMGFDAGPVVYTKGDWIWLGSSWSELCVVGYDVNWGIEAIIEGQGVTQLAIGTIKGPWGITADVQNIGEDNATNVTWSITATGGLFKRINASATGAATVLVVGESEPMNSGIFFGFGKINMVITASAQNAFEVTVTKSAFLLGPFVVGIK